MNNLFSKIKDTYNKIKASNEFIKAKEYWYSLKKEKKQTIIIGGIIVLLLVLCCFCSLISPSDEPESTPAATQSTSTPSTDFFATKEIEIRTHVAATIYAEITQTQAALPTQSPSPTNTINSASGLPSDGRLVVSFIDVGQGDAILIRSPEGLYGLIDGGEQGSGVVEYLKSQGVQSLDFIIASHPHSDHIGGLIDVLNAFPTSRVITNGEMHTTSTYESFLDAIITSQAEYLEVKRGDTLSLGSLVFDVFHPSRIVEKGLNLNSIVALLSYGKTSFLFMGDASKESENEIILAGIPLKADILKVGHHCSDAATSDELLSSVQPVVAIYSAGKGNDYGHPNPKTLNRLQGSGSEIYGTDVNGTIVVEVVQEGYSVKTEFDETLIPLVTVPDATTAVEEKIVEDINIEVVSLTSPISAGSNARLTIQTMPDAFCTISVIYKSGPSQAAGLGPQNANSSGQASWSWKVGSRTSSGTWRINVNCNLDGKSADNSIPFEVN